MTVKHFLKGLDKQVINKGQSYGLEDELCVRFANRISLENDWKESKVIQAMLVVDYVERCLESKEYDVNIIGRAFTVFNGFYQTACELLKETELTIVMPQSVELDISKK